MSNELIHVENELQSRMKYAETLSKSDLLPAHYRGKPANTLIALEYAQALNIPAVQALSDIIVINGKPSVTSNLMSALVRNAGHKLRIIEKPECVTATLIRRDDPDYEFTSTWDKAKAVQAQLWGAKGPWTQYPTAMLRARAISEVIRQGATEVLMGIKYSTEELESTPSSSVSSPVVDDLRTHITKAGKELGFTGAEFMARLHEKYPNVTWENASDEQLQETLNTFTTIEVEVVE